MYPDCYRSSHAGGYGSAVHERGTTRLGRYRTRSGDILAPDTRPVPVAFPTGHDRDAVLGDFQAVVAAGDIYVFDTEVRREEALAYWFHPDTLTYVAEFIWPPRFRGS